MLYVGATLMIGASVYGFVDYRKSSRKKEFENMYVDQTKTQPVVIDSKPVEKSLTGKTELVVNTKNKSRKQEVVSKEATKEDGLFSIKPISEQGKVASTKTDLDAKTGTTITPNKESSIIRTVIKRRRLKSNLFSRAPLRDEVIEVREPIKETKNN
jgi:hypothetical protein